MNKKLVTKLGHRGADDMRPNHLVKNKDVYYYRRRIPEHLLAFYSPKTEIKFSLKTKIKSVAEIKASEAETHYLKQFEQAEKKLSNSKAISFEQMPEQLVPFLLDDTTQEALANKYLHNAIIEEDDLFNYIFNTPNADLTTFESLETFKQYPDDAYTAISAYRISLILEGSDGEHKRLAISQLKEIEIYYSWASYYSKKQGIDFGKLSDTDKRNLTRRYLIAERNYAIELQRRIAGDFRSADKVVNKDEIYQKPSTTWEEVFKLWENESDSRAKSVAAYHVEFEKFRKFVKNIPVEQVARKNANYYKAYLKEQNLTIKTINKKISFLITIFSKAHRNELLKDNPLNVDLFKDNSSPIKRRPFNAEDLQTIFNSDIYLNNSRPDGGGGEAAYWVPAIAYYTGARLEEICQLRKSNFLHDHQYGYYFQIIDIDENGQPIANLKNHNSVRNIPVHQDLINIGLLDFINSVNDEFIFSELTLRAGYPRSVNFSKWFNRHLNHQLGITSKLKVFHSFRHTFTDLCRNSRIPKELWELLTGHEGEGVSGNYGDGHNLEILRQEMDKIKTVVKVPRWRP